MAKIHGMAGEWARVKGTVIGLTPVFAALFASGLATAIAVTGKPILGIIMLAVSLCAGCSFMIGGIKRIERHFVGARGEERVSNLLSNLSDRYHVFNDFAAGPYHVDHVVVGPAGVFAIETKYWNGRVTIEEGRILADGVKPSRPPLVQVQREAAAVKNELEKAGWCGAVTPILVFASDSFVSRIAELNGVVVLNSSEIEKSFSTERIIIAQDELERLVSLMENNI